MWQAWRSRVSAMISQGASMYFRIWRFKHGLLCLRNVAVVVFVCVLSLVMAGCGEEEPKQAQQPRQVVRHKIPPQKRPPALKKAPAGAQAEQKSESARAEEKSEPAPAVTAKKEPPAPSPGEGSKKPPAQEREVPKAPPKEAEKEQQKEPEKMKQKQEVKPAEAGIYRVEKGDTLYTIAGRDGVYGDSLRWPSLFRLNMDRLSGSAPKEGLPHEELPPGLELKYLTPEEARERRAQLASKPWVVNVFSSQASEKIIPLAVRLMKEGYHVYITKAEVKGQEWIRLRAGFFQDASEAKSAAGKITSVVKIQGVWIAKAGKEELAQVGGY